MENFAKVLIVEDEPNALMGLAELISACRDAPGDPFPRWR